MTVQPASRLSGLAPYRPSRAQRRDAVRLHANEGRAPALGKELGPWLEGLDIAKYASTAELEAQLASIHGVGAERVVVTAGADDALLRVCLSVLEPGRRAVLSRPTFEMIPRYVQLAGGAAEFVPWLDAPFPEAAFARALDLDHVAAAFVVTPSSPSGEVAPLASVERLADQAEAKGRLLVVDLAYVEFAEADPTERLARRGDVVLTRTLSKALGLAGLRVGYAIAPEPIAEWLRTVGQPYAVSSPSLAIASQLLGQRREISERARARVLSERGRLFDHLASLGAQPIRSEANSLLARFGARSGEIVEALARHGFRVRAFRGSGPLEGTVRIACPQDEEVFADLLGALARAVRGQTS